MNFFLLNKFLAEVQIVTKKIEKSTEAVSSESAKKKETSKYFGNNSKEEIDNLTKQ